MSRNIQTASQTLGKKTKTKLHSNGGTRIVDGFERGGFGITLPRRLSWSLKLANMLPYPAYFWLISATAGRGRKGSRP